LLCKINNRQDKRISTLKFISENLIPFSMCAAAAAMPSIPSHSIVVEILVNQCATRKFFHAQFDFVVLAFWPISCDIISHENSQVCQGGGKFRELKTIEPTPNLH